MGAIMMRGSYYLGAYIRGSLYSQVVAAKSAPSPIPMLLLGMTCRSSIATRALPRPPYSALNPRRGPDDPSSWSSRASFRRYGARCKRPKNMATRIQVLDLLPVIQKALRSTCRHTLGSTGFVATLERNTTSPFGIIFIFWFI